MIVSLDLSALAAPAVRLAPRHHRPVIRPGRQGEEGAQLRLRRSL